ncbi:MAG TPA: phage virion morphogenesis protein [Alphaproteobacteria bacterium]|nr:phage virion morphogenesis protein [Alphaproteobacteria bacterium]
MKFSVTIDDKELQKKLKNLKDNSKNLKSTMADISVYMKKQVMDNFEAEGRPQRWKSLSKKYLEYKLSVKGVSKILEFHGKLKQSISSSSTKNEARTFTGVKYGVHQQTGTGKMIARPFMPDKKNEDMPPFDKLGMEYIKRKLTEAVMKGV